MFVGHVSARVRELLWQQVADLLRDGRAIMINSARNEQHMEVRNFRHDWEPVDMDGVTLIRRPAQNATVETRRMRYGWSMAARKRRGRSSPK